MRVTGFGGRAIFAAAGSTLAAVVLSLGLLAVPAGAEPTPTPAPAAEPIPGKKVCSVSDIVSPMRPLEISGLLALEKSYYVVNASDDDNAPSSRKQIFKLNSKCKVTQAIPLSNAVDAEDLALGPDGDIWIADTGDSVSKPKRERVALWRLSEGKITGPYRLTYPKDKHNAEALLIADDGTPIIIAQTNDFSGVVKLFSPTAPIKSGNTVPMEEVGELTLPRSDSPNPHRAAGRKVVTGAAISPDRSKVVLRTYGDAFEWDVKENNILTTLTAEKPRRTQLPDEHLGKAISYSADGTKLLTVPSTYSLKADDKNRTPVIRSYTPSVETFVPADLVDDPKAEGKPWWDALVATPERLYMVIGSVGLFGLLLVLLGVIVILKSRKKRRKKAGIDRMPGDNSETTILAPVPSQPPYYDEPGYAQQSYAYADQGYEAAQQGYPPQQGYSQGYPPQAPGPGYGDQGYPEQYPPQQPYDPGYGGGQPYR